MNLINFEFDPQEHFEPSAKTKWASLYTHKSAYRVAGTVLPGFFQTSRFPWQLVGFFMIFILEGLATAWSFEEGASVQIIIGLMLFDIVLAIASHWYHASYVEHANHILFAEDHLANALQLKLRKAVIWRNVFYLLIFASAVLKFAFFFMVYLFFDATALLIAVCYLIGGVLHILCTGYAIYTLIVFAPKIGREHKKYVTSTGTRYIANELDLEVDVNGLAPKEIVVGEHRLYQRDGQYFLSTKGILTDGELRNMIAKQVGKNERWWMATEGVKRQFTILSMEPIQEGQHASETMN